MGELLKEMGQRMLDRRKQLKLTQEALAKMAHVTPQTVSTAELGTKAMRPETILKICDALDISTDYLLRGQVMEGDTRLLNQKVSSLTPSQYRHLENIIDNFIAAAAMQLSYLSFYHLPWRKASIVLEIRPRMAASASDASSSSGAYSGSGVRSCGAGAVVVSAAGPAAGPPAGFSESLASWRKISRTMASMAVRSMGGAAALTGWGSSAK